MAKYIDADLLRKEINERLSCNGAFDEVGDSAWHYDQGIIAAYKHILSFIDSLQQDKAAVELKQCPPVLAEFMKKASEIGEKYNYGFGPNLTFLPQTKVDLEKEIEIFTTRLYNDTFGNGQGTLDKFDWEDIAMVIEETARHFYELCQLNAR